MGTFINYLTQRGEGVVKKPSAIPTLESKWDIWFKLIQSNQPQAKFRLKSDSNRLLIVFNPKSESESESLQQKNFSSLKKDRKVQNQSISIENGQI